MVNRSVLMYGSAAIVAASVIAIIGSTNRSSNRPADQQETFDPPPDLEIPDLNIPEFGSEIGPATGSGQADIDRSGSSPDGSALLFRVTVNRSGFINKVNSYSAQPKIEDVTWTYGPAIAEIDVYQHTALDWPERRKWLIGTLGAWSPNIDYYHDLIAQFGRTDPAQSYLPAARWDYYERIEPEINRLSAVVKAQADDVEFMLRFLGKQQWHALEASNGSLLFATAPPAVDVELENAYGHRTYYNYNAVIDKKEETVSISNLAASNRNRPHPSSLLGPMDFSPEPVAPRDLPKTADVQFPDLDLDFVFSQWDVSEADLERARDLIANWQSVSSQLQPVSASDLSLSGEAATWYTETTAPLLQEIFHNAYRDGLNEVVRYLWYYSDQEMPRDMRPASPDTPDALYQAYTLVDSNGVDIIRNDASLRLPDLSAGRKFRMTLAQQGFVQARSMSGFVGFEDFNRENFELSATKPITHRLVHRLPQSHYREAIFKALSRPGDYDMPPQSTRNYSIEFDPKINQWTNLDGKSLVEIDANPNDSDIPVLADFNSIDRNQDGAYFSMQFMAEDALSLSDPITFDQELSDRAFLELKSQNAEYPFTVDAQYTLKTPYPEQEFMRQRREEELTLKIEFTTSDLGFPEQFVAYGATTEQLP